MDDLSSGLAAIGIAFEFTGARKLTGLAKYAFHDVEIQSRDTIYLSFSNGYVYLPILKYLRVFVRSMTTAN